MGWMTYEGLNSGTSGNFQGKFPSTQLAGPCPLHPTKGDWREIKQDKADPLLLKQVSPRFCGGGGEGVGRLVIVR